MSKVLCSACDESLSSVALLQARPADLQSRSRSSQTMSRWGYSTCVNPVTNGGTGWCMCAEDGGTSYLHPHVFSIWSISALAQSRLGKN